MTLAEENHCLRCGALLPDSDEGICPSCGTPFGKATQAMKVDPERLREIAEQRRAQATAAAQASQAAAPALGAAKEAPKTILFIVVGLIVLLLLAVAYLVVM